MIPPRRVAEIGIDDRIDAVAKLDRLPQNRPMRKHPLHRFGAAADIGDDGVMVVAHQPARIANLPTGVGVEAGAIEDNLDRIAGIRRRNALAVFHDRQNLRAIDAQLA